MELNVVVLYIWKSYVFFQSEGNILYHIYRRDESQFCKGIQNIKFSSLQRSILHIRKGFLLKIIQCAEFCNEILNFYVSGG